MIALAAQPQVRRPGSGRREDPCSRGALALAGWLAVWSLIPADQQKQNQNQRRC